MHFRGYPRPGGGVGVRNHLLVVPTVICASVVAERVAAAVPGGAALPHLAGCGQLGPDLRVTHDTLAAYCRHPNVGAVLSATTEAETGRCLRQPAFRASDPVQGRRRRA